jgi:hypothetical protein
MVSAGLRDDRDLDLGAVAEVVGGEAEAFAVEGRLLAACDGTEAGPESPVLTIA